MALPNQSITICSNSVLAGLVDQLMIVTDNYLKEMLPNILANISANIEGGLILASFYDEFEGKNA